jgi:hypothetical protein
MPEISPLRPIAHWRSGRPPNVRTLVLKSKPLRQLDRFAVEDEG